MKLLNQIRISHGCPLLWSYWIWSESPMFAHYCEVTESDQELPCLPIIVKLLNLIRNIHVCPVLWSCWILSGSPMFVHYYDFTELIKIISVWPLLRLQNLIRISHVAQYCEVTELDHDYPCLRTVVRLQNLIRISMIACLLSGSYRIWSGSPMFAHYQEVTESDQDLPCLPVIMKLQNLIRIYHSFHCWEVTQSDQHPSCLHIFSSPELCSGWAIVITFCSLFIRLCVPPSIC